MAGEKHLLGALQHLIAYATKGKKFGKIGKLFFDGIPKMSAPKKKRMSARVRRTPRVQKAVKVNRLKDAQTTPRPLDKSLNRPKSSFKKLFFISSKNPLPPVNHRSPINMG